MPVSDPSSPDAPLPASGDAPEAPKEAWGLVTRSTGSWYTVRTDDGEDVQARIRGKFRLEAETIDETNPLAVGDRVRILLLEDERGMVQEIAPRENQLSRRAAGHRARSEHVIVTNLDRAWCVQATFQPKLNPGFVDRFMVAAEASHIPAGLVLNKADLLEGEPRAQEALEFWAELYKSLGYPVLFTSAETGEGVDAFRDALEGKVSVVSGPSGAGKSSLLNAVDPELDLVVGEVSEKTNKGRHTTTFATLFQVAGGWVADTPGIREFGIWGMTPEELGGYFVEFRPFLDDCRYPNCTHDHEPGCAIQDAVDAEHITPERYGSYLQMLESVRADARSDQEADWRRRDSRPDEEWDEPED